jgi:putative transposase
LPCSWIFSRVGSSAGQWGERQDEALASNALKMAIEQRARPGLVHHTDQSVLYRARGYRETLDQHGVRPSMGGKGNALDNAVVESFFSNLKK